MKPGWGAQPCACLREHSTGTQAPLGGFEVERVEVRSRASARGLPAWSGCSSQGMGSRSAPGQGLPEHKHPDLDLILLISIILLIGRSQGLLSQSDSLLTAPPISVSCWGSLAIYLPCLSVSVCLWTAVSPSSHISLGLSLHSLLCFRPHTLVPTPLQRSHRDSCEELGPGR